MEFAELIRRRRSVRHYEDAPLPEGALERVLEAAAGAPSAGNLQAWRVCVVRSPEKRAALARAAHDQMFIAQAPVSLVFFADRARSAAEYGERGRRLYALQDATIAAAFAVLSSVDQGLASVWIGSFDEGRVQWVCGEAKMVPVAIIPLGRAAESPPAPDRRARTDLVGEV